MTRWRLAAATALLALSCMADARLASAHTRSISYSTWELDAAGATVRARASRLDFTRIGIDPGASPQDRENASRYLAEHLSLTTEGEPCELQRPPIPLTAASGWVAFGWRLTCPVLDSGETPILRTIRSDFLTAVAPSHLQFARLEFSDGLVIDRVLSSARPAFQFAWAGSGSEIPDGSQKGSKDVSASNYFGLGLEHILSGWDHLAFVIALLLLAGSLGEVTALVTAFTVAHSVTLGLAALGFVQPDAAAVEALIGFSIALVAVENSWILSGRRAAIPVATLLVLGLMAVAGTSTLSRIAVAGLALFSLCHFALLQRAQRPARLRAAIAFAFGLVHGFGFAGILEGLSLPTQRLVPALFGFNLGVEVGQLGVVILVWPLLRELQRRNERHGRLAIEVASAAICGLGVFWFVTRSYG